ncbi:hypothetical protein ALC62_02084 [Cyphomyrmex costatus]|uniref:Uncharacterized protein n=1 Tax=Cyphomyrmex costatus TaxID=456900 RepID=A0A151INC8_9HYME|nr:hypothetical protein ALC62_02084 [Cyphomyrmex costatus]
MQKCTSLYLAVFVYLSARHGLIGFTNAGLNIVNFGARRRKKKKERRKKKEFVLKDFGETRRGRSSMVLVPIRALLSIFLPSVSLFLSRLSRLSLGGNFHRKFSLQAQQSATPEAAARGGSECSVVFISAPNEFAGCFSCTHTLIAPRRTAFGS